MAPLLSLCTALNGGLPAQAADKLRVVATLPTFADLAKAVGGDRVEVSAVASPLFNPHFIEPKPSDVLKVKRADLFIHGGLDMELWRGPLLDAAGNLAVMPGGARELDLSRGVALLEVPGSTVSRQEGDIHLYGNPHYWLDPGRARELAQSIAEKLASIDPDHADAYRGRLDAWLAQLDGRVGDWRARLAPHAGREIVGYHNAWPYLMEFSGLRMEQFLEPKPGIPPTPKHLEFLRGYVAEHHIPAIVRATFEPKEAGEALAKQTGARLVVLCQSVGELPACSDYAAMLDYDVQQLADALQ